jgi:hypothetical protein
VLILTAEAGMRWGPKRAVRKAQRASGAFGPAAAWRKRPVCGSLRSPVRRISADALEQICDDRTNGDVALWDSLLAALLELLSDGREQIPRTRDLDV